MRKMKVVLPLIGVVFLLSVLAADSNDITKLENQLAAAQGKDKLPPNSYISGLQVRN